MKILGLLLLGIAIFGMVWNYSARFLDWLRFQSIGTRDYVVEKLQLMFIEVSPNQVLLGQFVISLGLGTVVFLLFLPQILPAILFGGVVTVIGWKAPKPIVDYIYKQRVTLFVTQMVDALGLMANGMRSGLSVVQAMGLVSQEMKNPVKQEFELVLSENKLGVSVEESFLNLSKRVKSDDVEMFVTAVNILKETGGNLAETMDTIVITIRERIKVEKKIEALTTQGLVQGYIVMSVPPVLGAAMYFSDPDAMRPLFTTAPGWIAVFVIVALEAVAYVAIKKLLRIDI